MGNSVSVLEELLAVLPSLRPQMYFKTSLTALSHAMEDQVLAGDESPLMIASFQQERFYRQEAHRYLRLAEVTPHIYVLAAADTQFADGRGSAAHETVAFAPDDNLVNEWHLVVLGNDYTACLICREHYQSSNQEPKILSGAPALDQSRRFEGIWTLNRQVCEQAAHLLLQRVIQYRPDLSDKVADSQGQFLSPDLLQGVHSQDDVAESSPFAQRLVTYVQASQYKLLKAYKAMAAQENRERLINSITAAIRQSLNPTEVFAIATHELGQQIDACRCIIYRSSPHTGSVKVHHEFRQPKVSSLKGESWPLLDNPLFQKVVGDLESLTYLANPSDVSIEDELGDTSTIHTLLRQWDISAVLLVPLIYQERLLGIIELHQCSALPHAWNTYDIRLVESVAAQLSVAVIQAEAYANLENLNQQLEALDRTRSNLIAITGHELRTPLSTIRVCLESISTEPDMPEEMRQIMLQTALEDSDRMQNLVQDFLTLSRLESGRIEWNLESLALSECIALALSSRKTIPNCSVTVELTEELPLIRGDGEWIVEVLTKLLDNACKFTSAEESISIQAFVNENALVEVSVNDTGRGIEPERLETVFERFYQEEGALRRSVGGTGLGLAICRQIVEAQGGKIWAMSKGKDQGTQIHFTLPIAAKQSSKKRTSKRGIKPKSRKISV
ncbi:MAG: DICT sensory domain-containing protein [Cyanobacteria bacterium P01_D01_bin.156]